MAVNDCSFRILRYLVTKLHNFTKFMMLFPAVLINFVTSKVCVNGEGSILFKYCTTNQMFNVLYIPLTSVIFCRNYSGKQGWHLYTRTVG
jgi:hypothetical protein